MSAIDHEVLADLARLGSATVYEAGGRGGYVDLDLHQVIAGSRVAGPARTVACTQDSNVMVHAAMETIVPGEVLVLCMPQARPVALLGDLLATQARAQGAAGVLVDASVRDLEELRDLGLPIWARWVRVRGAGKDGVGKIGVPVTVGGARIRQDDVLVCDADGIAVVAAEHVAEVLEASRVRERDEQVKREKLAAGALSYDLDGLRAAVRERS